MQLVHAVSHANLKLRLVLVRTTRTCVCFLTYFLALSYVVPDHGYIGGGETVVVYGGPFPSKGDSGEDLIYSCVFSTDAGPGTPSGDGKSLAWPQEIG